MVPQICTSRSLHPPVSSTRANRTSYHSIGWTRGPKGCTMHPIGLPSLTGGSVQPWMKFEQHVPGVRVQAAAVAAPVVAAAAPGSQLLVVLASLYSVPLFGLMVFRPKWDQTKALLESFKLFVPLALIYGYLLAASWQPDTLQLMMPGSLKEGLKGFQPQYFPKLEGISMLFSRLTTAASVWVHILTINLFIARQAYLKGLDARIPTAHSVLLAAFFGPLAILSMSITQIICDLKGSSPSEPIAQNNVLQPVIDSTKEQEAAAGEYEASSGTLSEPSVISDTPTETPTNGIGLNMAVMEVPDEELEPERQIALETATQTEEVLSQAQGLEKTATGQKDVKEQEDNNVVSEDDKSAVGVEEVVDSISYVVPVVEPNVGTEEKEVPQLDETTKEARKELRSSGVIPSIFGGSKRQKKAEVIKSGDGFIILEPYD